MIIPWLLVASVAAATAAGLAPLRRDRAVAAATVDLVASVALPALLVGRVAVLLRDVLLTRTVPPPAAWLAITAGLSAGAALLAGAVAGARTLRRQPDAAAARAAPESVAVALGVWGLTALLRGDAGGIAAPPPLGVPLPGSGGTVVPVALIEAATWGGLWLALARGRARELPPARRWAAVGLLAAAQALLGPTLRPGLPTVDRDVETLMAVTAVVVMALLLRGRAPAAFLGGAVGSIAVLGLLAVSGSDAAPTRLPPWEGGAALPDLSAAIIVGADVPARDVAQLDGAGLAAVLARAEGPVVVNLWASWCPPCHAEAPTIARAARALPADVTVLGLLIDDDPAEAQAFADRYGLGFATLVDAGAATALGYAGLPTTVVLRPDGDVVQRVVGGVDDGDLAAAVDRARRV